MQEILTLDEVIILHTLSNNWSPLFNVDVTSVFRPIHSTAFSSCIICKEKKSFFFSFPTAGKNFGLSFWIKWNYLGCMGCAEWNHFCVSLVVGINQSGWSNLETFLLTSCKESVKKRLCSFDEGCRMDRPK